MKIKQFTIGNQISKGWTGMYILFLLLIGASCGTPQESPPPPDLTYSFETPTDPDGSGKVYMGREIARVSDTEETPAWLDRPDRVAEELPDRVIQSLELKETDVVADIGAGTGYFAFRIAPSIPQGRVLAVDIQQEMLDIISERKMELTLDNVDPVLGTIDDPNLPIASVDVAIIVSSYHEFSHPNEMMNHIVSALRPGGRFVLVEYRGEDPTIPISDLRRMTEEQARHEMEAVGLEWIETKGILPQQHLMIFGKPGP